MGYPFLLLSSPGLANGIPYKVFSPPNQTHGSSNFSKERFIVLIHGLNLRPERMDELAVALSRYNTTVLRVALTGHRKFDDGSTQEMTDASRQLWLSEVSETIAEAKRLAVTKDSTYSLAGFSLGGALIWDYLATVENQQSSPHPASVLLIAPAVAPKWYAQATRLLFFWPGLTIPSLSPGEFRVHTGTTIGGYLALLDIRTSVRAIDKISSQVPVTVIANPDDELVSYSELTTPPLSVQFQNYKVVSFTKEKSPATDKLPRHLMIDSSSMTPGDWEKFQLIVAAGLGLTSF